MLSFLGGKYTFYLGKKTLHSISALVKHRKTVLTGLNMAEGASTRGEVEVSDTQQEEGLTNDKKEEESKTQEQMEEPTNDKKEEGSVNQEQMEEESGTSGESLSNTAVTEESSELPQLNVLTDNTP